MTDWGWVASVKLTGSAGAFDQVYSLRSNQLAYGMELVMQRWYFRDTGTSKMFIFIEFYTVSVWPWRGLGGTVGRGKWLRIRLELRDIV